MQDVNSSKLLFTSCMQDPLVRNSNNFFKKWYRTVSYRIVPVRWEGLGFLGFFENFGFIFEKGPPASGLRPRLRRGQGEIFSRWILHLEKISPSLEMDPPSRGVSDGRQ